MQVKFCNGQSILSEKCRKRSADVVTAVFCAKNVPYQCQEVRYTSDSDA